MLVCNIQLIAIIAKIIDDFLLAGVPSIADRSIAAIASKVELVTIVHSPKHLRYFGLNIHQQHDNSTVVDDDDNLNIIASMPFTSLRSRELYASLSSFKAKSFATLNPTVGWLDITSSLFCAVFLTPSTSGAFFQHQSLPRTIQRLLSIQVCGSTVSFPRPTYAAAHALSITVLSKAGRSVTHRKVCSVSGLLLGELRQLFIFQVWIW